MRLDHESIKVWAESNKVKAAFVVMAVVGVAACLFAIGIYLLNG
jgi:hypothetical protein